ncbi:hypothetical protein MPL1032_30121 [Mesorhizobium plurifarium]|uniref:Uncharacterized protein n=1 Tax=Mesorhizobium plurifarium TaxID=69974 RepID=A0A0K2W2S7_MESPL|nr:hypothetical protein MPL1032_30121 [Mesorhizobium plurifarium]
MLESIRVAGIQAVFLNDFSLSRVQAPVAGENHI